MQRRQPQQLNQSPPARARQRAYAIAAMPEGDDLSELGELLRTAGVAVVGELVQHREQPHPNHYLGQGKVEELKELIKKADANVVVADDELTPRQERNLEKALDVPVLDRTAVILDIFAGHAHTAEGKLQVELAQLEYNMARMRGLWTHLERLGAGRGVGGIGTRGPGESQIETSASARTSRASPWPATPTPASRRCSTRSPARRSASATASSTRWTRPRARSSSRAARS
jgi:GTP-binding protein HflX